MKPNPGKLRSLAVILLMLALLTWAGPVQADIAPPGQPPGANPQPGSAVTEVRMLAESVLIEVQAKSPSDTLGTARVSAEFTMRNLGNEAESMAVRFPVGASDGRGGTPIIKDMLVRVDGRNAFLSSNEGEDPNYGGGNVPWVEFEARFAPQQDVVITVTYTLEAIGEMPYLWFNYIFSTGAGWKDSIGSADLTARFPYEINEMNVVFCAAGENYNCTPRGGTVDGKQVTWHFEDFEPQQQDNFTLLLAAPSVWSRVLDEKMIIESRPDDGEAWGRLGKVYKSLLFSPHGRRGFRGFTLLGDPGAQELFRLSDEAYSRSVELKPQDALWHAGYADLLGYYAYFAGYENVETIPLKVKALAEIYRALELKPLDPTIQTIASDMSYMFPEGIIQDGEQFDFPWLTQTPQATATDIMPVYQSETPLPVVPPTATIQPAMVTNIPTETTTPAPEPSAKQPLCGSAVLIPLLMLGGVIIQRSGVRNR